MKNILERASLQAIKIKYSVIYYRIKNPYYDSILSLNLTAIINGRRITHYIYTEFNNMQIQGFFNPRHEGKTFRGCE